MKRTAYMIFVAYFKKLQFLRYTQLSLSILLLFFLFPKIQAQPLFEWSAGLGGSLNDLPEVVYATSDGNFIIAGQSASSDGSLDNNKGGADLWVAKLDENGNLIWEKNYGGAEDDFAMDLQPTTDGGFIMTGGSASMNGDLTDNKGRLDLWVLKINAQGELQWSKSFGGSGVDIGSSIQPISGGYILAGCTGSAGELGVSAGFGGNEFWVLQLDLNGDLVWEKTYGGKRHDTAKTIVINNNGEYLIAGNTWSNDGDVSNNHGHGDAWVIKINNVGVLLWEKNFGGETPDRLNSLTKTNDGNYIVTLEATNVCGTVTTQETITVLTPVVAGFTADVTSGCSGLEVQFTDASSNNVTGWNWTFAGGTPSTSTEQNPTVIYNTPGTYSVVLEVNNSGFNATQTEMEFIVIAENPTASFTSMTTGGTVDFTNTSTNATSYLWEFGDGETSTDENPSYTYSSDGN